MGEDDDEHKVSAEHEQFVDALVLDGKAAQGGIQSKLMHEIHYLVMKYIYISMKIFVKQVIDLKTAKIQTDQTQVVFI